jgi:hypothetical protein
LAAVSIEFFAKVTSSLVHVSSMVFCKHRP